ncbi:MAG: Transcriptional regulator containing domain, AraC family [Verrucomicrobiota bacterium]|jgi:AraC-like DNA-binding protein
MAAPKSPSNSKRFAAFSEAAAWQSVPEGWRRLHGSFHDLGYSMEWHDFTTEDDLDWSRSFHPGGIEICLNLAGRGAVQAGSRQLELTAETAGFYFQNGSQLQGRRRGGERHCFVTVEFSAAFLTKHLEPKEKGLPLALKTFLAGKPVTDVSAAVRLSHEHKQLIASLSRPPVAAAAQHLWFHAKALEIAATVLYRPEDESEFFCERYNRQNHERVQRVIAVLRENLAEPPTLEEIGRRVGCSQFHLSRIFSQEMGKGIFQYLRALRMERAAELLRARTMNVTQVALEVGYTSPSHFSTAFHETHGCCPGLYPLRTLGGAGVDTK